MGLQIQQMALHMLYASYIILSKFIDDMIFQYEAKERAMKKIIMLGIVLATILVSLGGCCWPGYWHDGYGRGRHDRYDHYQDRGYHERR